MMKESVWDYPRPPVTDPVAVQVEVKLGGIMIAATEEAVRVLETSHPPVYYVPMESVNTDLIVKTDSVSFCGFKGEATYYTVVLAGEPIKDAAWCYHEPFDGYEAIKDHLAFYPSKVDCYVDGEKVVAQDGGFYGGWITSNLEGPFKGGEGTDHW